MLSITYLGHAGWAIQAGNHAVLVDPMLTPEFGRGPAGAQMPEIWPPRWFSFDKFPALDAVVISHEHEDHFNLRALNFLDRQIPIFISSRVSVAAYAVLEEMGFQVWRFTPGKWERFGPLELLPLSPDHIITFNADEWDGLALLARDQRDGGCFFTPIDIRPTADMLSRVTHATAGANCVLTFHNERLAWIETASLEAKLLAASNEDSAESKLEAATSLRAGNPLKVNPGATVVITSNELIGFEHQTEFVRTPPESQWPERPLWRYHPEACDYAPACGKYELTGGEWSEIEKGLQQFAEFLYGSVLYRRLYSLTEGPEINSKLTFALVLLESASRRQQVFEYQPAACAFQRRDVTHPFDEYISGVEVWATDLLALFRGDFEPRILSIGRSRFWRLNKSLPDPFLHLIWPFFHPQRRPAECLAGYRKQLATLAGGQERIYAISRKLTSVG